MKTISKKKLDELIVLTRQFWKDGSWDTLDHRFQLANSVEEESGLSPFNIIDLLNCILSSFGFMPEAENDVIYSVLRILGWEVSDEEHSSN